VSGAPNVASVPLPVQSVPITTNVSDLRQLSVFFLGIPVFSNIAIFSNIFLVTMFGDGRTWITQDYRLNITMSSTFIINSIVNTDWHDITEILLKVALNTINQSNPSII
jgi:hypothetical protein